MNRYEKARLDPTSVYRNPAQVLDDGSLSDEQKISILRRWEYDARELEVAEEENMGGDKPDLLDEVMQTLHTLHATIDTEHTPPTKQGGE